MKNRIDFLGIGTIKSGTTALHSYLEKHPDVFVPKEKELHFFSRNDYDSLTDREDLYKDYFSERCDDAILGEICPDYLFHEECAERIHAYNPEIKMIVILRNPVDRSYSAWNMRKNYFNEKRSFNVCMLVDIAKSFYRKQNIDLQNTYFRQGLYATQIIRFLEYFDRKQFLFIRYEDYVNNQKETLGRIYNFIGVDFNDNDFTSQKVFVSSYSSKLTSFSRFFLSLVYRPSIKRLEKLLGWDCSTWYPKLKL